MASRFLKFGSTVIAIALSSVVNFDARASESVQSFEGGQAGRFEGLDNRAAPGVLRYRLALPKGTRIAFKMSIKLLPDRFTEARSAYSAGMSLRVAWRKPDGSTAEAAAPIVCDSTNVANRRPATTCTWVFEAPHEASLAAVDDEYMLCVEDKTSPRPRRNFEWSIIGKQAAGKHKATLAAPPATKQKPR